METLEIKWELKKMIKCRKRNMQMLNPAPFKTPGEINIMYTACILPVAIGFISHTKNPNNFFIKLTEML